MSLFSSKLISSSTGTKLWLGWSITSLHKENAHVFELYYGNCQRWTQKYQRFVLWLDAYVFERRYYAIDEVILWTKISKWCLKSCLKRLSVQLIWTWRRVTNATYWLNLLEQNYVYFWACWPWNHFLLSWASCYSNPNARFRSYNDIIALIWLRLQRNQHLSKWELKQ